MLAGRKLVAVFVVVSLSLINRECKGSEQGPKWKAGMNQVKRTLIAIDSQQATGIEKGEGREPLRGHLLRLYQGQKEKDEEALQRLL